MGRENKGNNDKGTIMRVKDWPWMKAAMAVEISLVCSILWKGCEGGGHVCKDARQLKTSTQHRGQNIDLVSVSDSVATVAVRMLTNQPRQKKGGRELSLGARTMYTRLLI